NFAEVGAVDVWRRGGHRAATPVVAVQGQLIGDVAAGGELAAVLGGVELDRSLERGEVLGKGGLGGRLGPAAETGDGDGREDPDDDQRDHQFWKTESRTSAHALLPAPTKEIDARRGVLQR